MKLWHETNNAPMVTLEWFTWPIDWIKTLINQPPLDKFVYEYGLGTIKDYSHFLSRITMGD